MNAWLCLLLLLCTVQGLELLAGPKSRKVGLHLSFCWRLRSCCPQSNRALLTRATYDGNPYLQPNRTVSCPSR